MNVPYDKEDRGTTVIMHVNDEGAEYLEAYKLRSVLEKYCSFMPIEIYFADEDAEEPKEGEEVPEEKPINDTMPLWQKNPSECTDEEYKAFYHKVFGDFNDPLFWLHIKADYPLNFKGILYFPKLTHEFANMEGQVKLYYNQVFVADNIKEVIPEYLLMLRGVLDCPELPLNVSRSYLQNNGYVTKISTHIVKKVADKLNSLFKNDREGFEKMWGDIKTFCEYAALCDRKFYDKAKDALLMEVVHGGYVTLAEYLEGAKETNENTVYYASDAELQAQYISMFEAKGIKVVNFPQMIDTQYVQMLESVSENVKFKRVDSDLSDLTGEKTEGEEVNDALVTANMYVSGMFNVKFESILIEDELNANIIRAFIMSGNDEYDVAYLHDCNSASMALNGWFLNVNELPYLDPTAPWWPQFTVESLTYNGKLYHYSNYTSYQSMEWTWGCFFNQKILDDYNQPTPYASVRDGSWTLDKINAISPAAIEYQVEIKYYCTKEDEAATIEAIEGEGGAIDQYNEWQTAALARDINPDQLRRLILAPTKGTGALRVDVVKPSFAELSKMQVAKLKGTPVVSHEVVAG